MSKIIITDATRTGKSIRGNEIKHPTYFTGTIGANPQRHFFKVFELIVSLRDGLSWSCSVKGSPLVENFVEVDVEIIIGAQK